MLPDGRHFLFLAMKPAGTPKDPANRICVGSLDGGPSKPLVQANFNPIYADGYLLFIRGGDYGGSLIAQPFDPVRLETTGAPLTVTSQVAPYLDFAGLGSVSASATGALLYDASRLLTRIEFYDRAGRQSGTFGEPALRSLPRLAPDGRRLTFNQFDPGTQTTQVWVGDLDRGVETRLTSAPGSNASAIWAPDGIRVAYQSDVKHQADAMVRAADGTGSVDALTDQVGQRVPMAWSADGRLLVVYDREPAGERLVGLTALSVARDHAPIVVVPRRASNVVGAVAVARRPLARLRLGGVGPARGLRRVVPGRQGQGPDLERRRGGSGLDPRRPRTPLRVARPAGDGRRGGRGGELPRRHADDAVHDSGRGHRPLGRVGRRAAIRVQRRGAQELLGAAQSRAELDGRAEAVGQRDMTLPLAPASDPTRSSARSAWAAWARSIAPAMPASTATSR